MTEKKKKLTVKDVKEILAQAEVYEINKYSRYLVLIPKSNLVGGNDNLVAKGHHIAAAFKLINVPVSILIGVDSDVKFIELDVEVQK